MAICTQKLDCCDTCAQFAEKIWDKQTTLNRLQHTGSSDDEQLKHLKGSIEELQLDLEAHKLIAKKPHESPHKNMYMTLYKGSALYQATNDTLKRVPQPIVDVTSKLYEEYVLSDRCLICWGSKP